MKQVSELVICVVDFGFFVPLAEKLAERCKKVYYCFNLTDGYAKMREDWVGKGIKGVTQIRNWHTVIDDVDLFIFPDCYGSEDADYLRKIGKLVWGGSGTDWELDRMKTRQWQADEGMPIPDTDLVEGIESLCEMGKDKFAKISRYRGSMETVKLYNNNISQARLDLMKVEFGAYSDDMEFIVENKIEGVETGGDGWTVDGEYPETSMYGFEIKDCGYLGKIVEQDELPNTLKYTNAKLAKIFEDDKVRGFVSTEIRNRTATKGYLIDLTMRCYSDDTEILTEFGWKKFSDLLGFEKVATLNPENYNIEYHIPYAYQKFNHLGEMVHLKSRKKTIDLLVTPDHSIWARERNEGKLKSFRADDLRGRLTIPRTGNWVGNNQECFIVPEYIKEWYSGKKNHLYKKLHNPEVKIRMDVWAKFLGYYLSEGSCTNHIVSITQFKHKQKMMDELKEFPFSLQITKNGFQICSTQLCKCLKEFGLCDKKYIPNYIKQLSPNLIKLFIDAYGLGDGCYRKGQWRIFTTSKQMADDLQELFLKAGDVATITINRQKGTKMSVRGGKEYIRNHDSYMIAQSSVRKDCYLEGHTRKRSGKIGGGAYVEKENYSGFVYDLTVQNHIIYVRRNGIPCWSGNCPNPPYQIYLENLENLIEVMYFGAQGKLIVPKWKYKYGAIAIMNSAFAEHNWLGFRIPKENEPFIKIMNMCILNGVRYHLPIYGLSEVGAVVGLGNTLQTAIDDCKKHAEGVEADSLEIELSALDKAVETVKEGRKYGINF